MGSVGTAYNNAIAESLFATLECALTKLRSFETKFEARTALLRDMEGLYNLRRRHFGLGDLWPQNFGRVRHPACSQQKLETINPSPAWGPI